MNAASGDSAFQIGINIVSRSWRIALEEKRLMLIPFWGVIAILAIGCFIIVVAGAETLSQLAELSDQNAPHEEITSMLDQTANDLTQGQWIGNILQGIFSLFFQFATLFAVFRVVANQHYSVGGAISAAWSRIGRIIIFGVMLAAIYGVTVVIGALLTAALSLPGILLAVALFIVVTFPAFYLPTIMVAEEETGAPQALPRSWQLARVSWRALLAGFILLILLAIALIIGLVIVSALILLIAAAIHNIFLLLGGLIVGIIWVAYALFISVLSAVFDALMYQHAAGLVDGGAPPGGAPPPSDIDEDAFHKAKP